MLGFPILINPGYESFKIKETRVSAQEYPQWGDPELRAAYWETATAMSLLAAGAELLILYHPRSVETVKQKIREMFASGKGE